MAVRWRHKARPSRGITGMWQRAIRRLPRCGECGRHLRVNARLAGRSGGYCYWCLTVRESQQQQGERT